MLLQRMLRAALLDPAVYEELRRDRSANNQAFTVIGIVAACTLIGTRSLSPGAIFWVGLGTLGDWLFWSAIVMMVANRYRAHAEFDEVVRPVAFAKTPGVLMLFVLAPGWGWAMPLVAWLWSTVASFVAIREALRMSGREAALTMLFTTLIIAAISLVTNWTFGTFGMLMTQMRHWIAGI
jgi:hypothetical protein